MKSKNDLILNITLSEKKKISINHIPISIITYILKFLPSQNIPGNALISKLFNGAYKCLMNPYSGHVLKPFVFMSLHRLRKADQKLNLQIKQQSKSIYEKGLACLCLMGVPIVRGEYHINFDLSSLGDSILLNRLVNLFRLFSVVLCSLSAFGFYRALTNNHGHSIPIEVISGLGMVLSGGILLIDAVQSTRNYLQKRRIAENKERVSEIITLISHPQRTSINQQTPTVVYEEEDNDSKFTPF